MSAIATDNLFVRSSTYERRAKCHVCDFEIDNRTTDRVPTTAKAHVAETGHAVTIRTVEVNTWERTPA
jgi:hypothetical protein